MLVSFASGVSTKMSLYFHTSSRMPWLGRLARRGVSKEADRPHHIVPCGDNGLHIKITWEERHNAVWNDFAVFDQNTPEIPHDGRVVSDFKLRANSHLIAPTRDYLHHSSALGTPSPNILTKGKKQFRVKVMGYVSWSTGVNWSILGYMSRGEIVPEVMTTLLNLSKTGFIASDGSRHLESYGPWVARFNKTKSTYTRWKIGLGVVALSVS